jgi:hypothetical protein
MKADQSQASSSNHNPQAATNESIKSIAESVGIGNLSDEACRDLVSDLSFTIKLILNVADISLVVFFVRLNFHFKKKFC